MMVPLVGLATVPVLVVHGVRQRAGACKCLPILQIMLNLARHRPLWMLHADLAGAAVLTHLGRLSRLEQRAIFVQLNLQRGRKRAAQRAAQRGAERAACDRRSKAASSKAKKRGGGKPRGGGAAGSSKAKPRTAPQKALRVIDRIKKAMPKNLIGAGRRLAAKGVMMSAVAMLTFSDGSKPLSFTTPEVDGAACAGFFSDGGAGYRVLQRRPNASLEDVMREYMLTTTVGPEAADELPTLDGEACTLQEGGHVVVHGMLPHVIGVCRDS